MNEITLNSYFVEEILIKEYYQLGHQYDVIARFLNMYHGIHISLRTVKRRLKSYELSRRLHPSAYMDVWNAIHTELNGPGTNIFSAFQNTTLQLIYIYL